MPLMTIKTFPTPRRRLRKEFACLLVITSCYAILLYAKFSEDSASASKNAVLTRTSNQEAPTPAVNTLSCRIPDSDPYDLIFKAFQRPESENTICTGKPSFLVTKPNGVVTIDDKILRHYYGGLAAMQLRCIYHQIHRSPFNRTDPNWLDGIPQAGPTIEMIFNHPLRAEFILVTCYHNYNKIHEEFLALTPQKVPQRRWMPYQDKQQNSINILLFLMNSVSRQHFQRQFVRTKSFLKTEIGPDRLFEMKGFTKIADKTFLNLFALLAGRPLSEYYNESMKDFFWDDVPYIWKNFSQKHYVSLWSEQDPIAVTGRFFKKGFKTSPHLHNDLVFTKALDSYKLFVMGNKSQQYCIGDKLELEIQYKYVQNFIDTYEGVGFKNFIKTYVGTGHNYFVTMISGGLMTRFKPSYATFADLPTAQFLDHLHANGHLDNTLVVFGGINGLRVRGGTFATLIENRMPFLYIIVPKNFKSKYPEAVDHLRENQNRLTTPYDIHATIAHITMPVWWESMRFQTPKYGISLFDSIPEHRTCDSASIPPFLCVCLKRNKENVTITTSERLAKKLVQTINELLIPVRTSCIFLTLKSILSVRKYTLSDEVRNYKGLRNASTVMEEPTYFSEKRPSIQFYKVKLLLGPCNRVIEGTVRFNEHTGTIKVEGDITRRIKVYSKSEICISDNFLKQFCCCRVPHT